MSFLANLENKADSFSEFDASCRLKESTKPMYPTAHDVPIRPDEKRIPEEDVPYALRILMLSAARAAKKNEIEITEAEQRKRKQEMSGSSVKTRKISA